MNDALLSYESGNYFKKYKFGLLYVKDGQVEENEYYSNGKAARSSIQSNGDQM
jgi:hypothetical protein